MAAQSDRLIFLHIPKTGGTTLDQIMRDQFDASEVVRINRDRARIIEASQPSEMSHQYISGHFPFGLHRAIPGNSRYITMLREPTARAISHYHSWLRRNDRDECDMSLEEFLQAGHAVDNHQTRLVSGHRGVDGPVSEEMLDEAMRNLTESFLFVGVTERFDECVVLLTSKAGWEQPPLYERRNTTVRRLKVQDLSDNERTLIRQCNELDYALYNFAKRIVDDQIRSIGHSAFARRVRAYRRRKLFIETKSQATIAARNYMPGRLKNSLLRLQNYIYRSLPASE